MMRFPLRQHDHWLIVLTRGQITRVDLDAGERVLGRIWRCDNSGYAVSSEAGKTILLHRLIASAPTKLEVDHLDGDRLNNRGANLRVATRRQNCSNLRPRAGSSRFRGVTWLKHEGKWQARLQRSTNGKKESRHLGLFVREEDAAGAWDAAALSSGWYDHRFLRLNLAGQHAAEQARKAGES